MGVSILLSDEAEARLRNIMEIRGLDSLETAAEFALAESERKALLVRKLYAGALPLEAWANAFYSEDELETLNAVNLTPVHRQNVD